MKKNGDTPIPHATNAEAMTAFCVKCGLNAQADDDTLLLTGRSYGSKETGSQTKRLGDMPTEGQGALSSHVNLKYPRKVDNSEPALGNEVYCAYDCGVFIVRDGKLLLYAPVYECGGPEINDDLVVVTGHETTHVIRLNDLTRSFKYHTR
jgi:hypothetical protein